MSQKLPNFLIAGTAKSGTTSLHYYLQQHPQIFMPAQIKETYFFITPKSLLGESVENSKVKTVDTFEEYQLLFKDADKSIHNAIGEATPIYLFFHENAIVNIKRYLNDPKIIVVLRNPVDRAFSNYLHHIRDNLETGSFENALRLEEERKRNNCWYSFRITEMGYYYDQIKDYMDNFSEVKILLYDELNESPEKMLVDIFNFLEVDPAFMPDISKRHNVTGVPKNKFVHKFLTTDSFIRSLLRPVILSLMPKDKISQIISSLKTANLKKPEVAVETRKSLLALYREDILKLQNLIKKDLSHWLTV